MGKILFLAHSAVPSGAELSLLRLAKQFPEKSLHVVFSEDGPLIARFSEAGIDVTVLEVSSSGSDIRRDEASFLRKFQSLLVLAAYGWGLGRQARKLNASLIVATSVKSLIFGRLAAWRAGVPLVWSVHDRVVAEYFGELNALLVRALGYIFPRALIVNSESTLRTLWPGRKDVLVLPPGIVTGTHKEDVSRRHLSQPVTRVAMVGRLSPWKGQLVFVEAFKRVFAGTDVQAVIVGGALFGEEAYEQELRRAAGDSGCDFLFTGDIENVRDVLLSSQIQVHASVVPEPFGSVVVEGLDAGCAVIATTPGGPAEILTDGEDGLLVDCGDIDGLESALRTLYKDEQLRYALAQSGLARASAFDIRAMALVATSWLESIRLGIRNDETVTFAVLGNPTKSGVSGRRP